MTDLKTRFQTLDALNAPDMWREIETRAQAKEHRVTRPVSWVFIGVAVMLALIVGGVLLVGSGVVKLSTTAPSTTATTTPFTAPSTAPTPLVTPRAAAWIATESMVEARSNHTATLLSDGRVLVAGGFNGGTLLATAELFDPSTGSWTPTGKMTYRHSGHTATLLADGRVLVAGGSPTIRQHAELYDPRSGTWSATADLSPHGSSFSPRSATILADGSVLVTGDARPELYDPRTETWRDTGQMVEPRFDFAATMLADGRLLVAGGGCCTQDRSLASAELYDPDHGTWAATGSLREARDYVVATLLLDGTVLVAGGAYESTGLHPLGSAELYDSASGSWTATADMGVVRGLFETFTLLQDGSVLAAGGTGGGGWLASAELYDPLTATWTATATMDGGRTGHTATRLADGTVLVAGGYRSVDANGAGVPMASAELYQPASGN
jgi:hypothetical protein